MIVKLFSTVFPAVTHSTLKTPLSLQPPMLIWTCSAVRKCSEPSLSPLSSTLVILCRSSPAQFWWRLLFTAGGSGWSTRGQNRAAPLQSSLLELRSWWEVNLRACQRSRALRNRLSLSISIPSSWKGWYGGGGVSVFGGCFPPIMMLRIKVETLRMWVSRCQDELWRGPSFLHHMLRPRFPYHNNVEHRFTMQLFPFVSAHQRENCSVTSIKIHNKSTGGQRANKSLSRESAADYSRLICFLLFWRFRYVHSKYFFLVDRGNKLIELLNYIRILRRIRYQWFLLNSLRLSGTEGRSSC